MAHSEPAVRHAVIALGALCETEPGDMKHACAGLIANHERKIVLSHYNKSIGCLVSRMSEATYSPELGLVICLLFVCIEFLQGNYHAAFTHLRNGFKLMYAPRIELPNYRDSLQTTYPPNVALDGSGFSRSSTEDKLIPIFTRGIAQALLYGSRIQEDLEIPQLVHATYSKRPFVSLSETQQAYFELRNASISHLYTMGRRTLLRQESCLELYQERDNLLACHHVWYENMRRFEKQHALSGDELIAASALKVSYHTTFVYVSCSATVIEKTYDNYLDHFKEILRHAQAIIDSRPPTNPNTAHFTFDIAIIPQLYFVATRCRCPVTRREAVALLERNPPREGLWDVQQHVVVSKRAIEMEEAEVNPDTGWPVEETRLWNCIIKAGMDRSGGFEATFLPATWIGLVDANGNQKMIREFFVL
ncbi:hypothetical protein J4E91_001749 [Alternaria rosae]|nr:hypothetical protein J4E91_001749 [Alternaria rosae]